ncbi:MAG: hypothetical protein ACAI38_08885 [Myxococcota bacterium]
MVTFFPLNDRAHLCNVADQLAKSRTSLDDPSKLAIILTKGGKVVVAGADAPSRPGRVDLLAVAPGGTEQQRIIGEVYQAIKAPLFSLVAKLSLAGSAACGTGALLALMEGNWRLSLTLAVVGVWTGVPAACEYMKQVAVGEGARRSLKANGVDLSQVHPEPESSFAEVLARSSVP